ncbi:unnamed protein product [Adineta steineri]|uniref:THO1-MOS11 C-terminal domain-containing protein n=1 Tax=Adineta steineri TaxID=433720 RepID=A0A813ULE1_9BILA|nr:unnamed protein product [Adineta steineri]
MAASTLIDAQPTVDPPEDTKELAETLTEFELTSGVISAEDEAEESAVADRIQQRLERFGKIAPEAKKISRALRFGTQHEAIDETAKKRRLERFGVATVSTEAAQEKKRQRGERFHTDTPTSVSALTKKNTSGKSTATTPVLTDEIKKRTERFGDISQVAKTIAVDEQKAKRAERFKPITSV